MASTNANINLNQSSTGYLQVDIDTIEYPTLDGIEMKKQVIEQFKNDRPIIDRSSKESAIETLKKKELLTEKALNNTEANLEAEYKLSEV